MKEKLATQNLAEEIWEKAKKKLRNRLSLDYAKKWFDKFQPHALEDGVIYLKADSDFLAFWIASNYEELLKETFQEITGKSIEVRLLGPEEDISTNQTSSTQDKETQPLPFHKQNSGSKHTSRNSKTEENNELMNLNPAYKFEFFIVGPNSEFAFASAQAVASKPGLVYNPLFIYGGTGLGKTHLLHAIGHEVIKLKPHFRVKYVTCEKFTNEYIEALQNGTIATFRKKYRSIDVLLIDDIQFLTKKERIQEEFFHTFNTLHESRKQIVITCDRPIGELTDIESRLVSRFEWGLVADLQPPDMETRIAILKAKQAQYGVNLPASIISFVAENIKSNVRRLEGALARIVAHIQFTGKMVQNEEEVRRLLGDLLEERVGKTITIELIQREVASFYDIRVADLIGKRRPEYIAFPRQVAMYLCRELTSHSLTAIGDAFGGRDHGTVLHAYKQIVARMEVDPKVREQIQRLRIQLLNGQ